MITQEQLDTISAGMQGCLTEIEKALDVFESGTPSAAYAMIPADLRSYVTRDEVAGMAGVPYDSAISIHAMVKLFDQGISLALDRKIEADRQLEADWMAESDNPPNPDDDDTDWGNEVW